MFFLREQRQPGKELRSVVVNALKEEMATNEKIIALDADLGSASKWTELKQMGDSRFINVGIAEANMVGVAAGLSLTGYCPFIHTFGPFATRRVLDQLFLSGAYGQNTINIYGSDPGFTAGHNGGTHTTFEDVALLRSIPEVTICDAADAVQMDWIIKAFSQCSGVHYVRGTRKSVKDIYESGASFTLGKGNLVRVGADYLLISSGQLLGETLEVAEILLKKGIQSAFIDMFTLKPFDEALVLEQLVGKKRVITIENHSVIGGLGSAVAEVIADHGLAIPLTRIGVTNRFGQVGTPAFLQEEYGLTTEKIVAQIVSVS